MSRKRVCQYAEITGEEVCQISELLAQGKTAPEIVKITGRSRASITKIRKGLGYDLRERKPDQKTVVWLLLNQYWHWKIPERKKKHSNFRTPYSNPGTWD